MRRPRPPTFQSFGASNPSGNTMCSSSTHQPIFKSGGKVVRDLAAQPKNDTTDTEDDERFADVSSAYSTSDNSEHEPVLQSPEERTLFSNGITLHPVERLSTEDLDMKSSGNTDDEVAEVVLSPSQCSVDTIQEVESRCLSREGESLVREQDLFDFEVLGNQIVSIVREEPEIKAPTFITRSACSERDSFGEESSLSINEDENISPLRLKTDSMLSERNNNPSSEEGIAVEWNGVNGTIPSLANVGKVIDGSRNTGMTLKPLSVSLDEKDESVLFAKVVRDLHIIGEGIYFLSTRLMATLLTALLVIFECIKVIAKWTTAAISRGTNPEETRMQSPDQNVFTQIVRNTCTHGNRDAVTDMPALRAITDHRGSSTSKNINLCEDDCGIFPPRTESGELSFQTENSGRAANLSVKECSCLLETVPRADERLKSVRAGSMETGSGSSVSVGTNETELGTLEMYSDARRVRRPKSQISGLKPSSAPGTMETSTKHFPREFDPSMMKVEYEQSDLVLSPLKITKFSILERNNGVTELEPTIAQPAFRQEEKKVQSTNDTKTLLKRRPSIAAGLCHKVTRSSVHQSNSKAIDELKAVKDSVMRVFSINKNYHEVQFESQRSAKKTLTLLADLLVKEYECTVAVKKNGGLKIRFEKSFDRGRKLRVRTTFHPTSQFSCIVAVCRSRQDDLTVSWRECDAFVKSFQSSLQS